MRLSAFSAPRVSAKAQADRAPVRGGVSLDVEVQPPELAQGPEPGPHRKTQKAGQLRMPKNH